MRDTASEILKGTSFGNDREINDNTHMMDDQVAMN